MIARRKGLPILLSEIAVAVARRLELPVVGLGIPGRYMIKYEGRRAPAGGGGACGGSGTEADPGRAEAGTRADAAVGATSDGAHVAEMAVTPQMLVPHARSAPRRGVRPARAASAGMAIRPTPTEHAAVGTVVQPSARI